VIARPLRLDVDGTPCLALLHPAGGPHGVLFCPPFGWEDVASYRSRRDWADRLSLAGYPALRFDLPGTGDSFGSPGLEPWTAAVAAAATALREAGGCTRVTAIGVGLGGLLAWRAAARGAAIDDLVLWAVPAGGRRLVRELKAFARIETASIVESGAPEPPPLPDGMIAPGGFPLDAALVEELSALDLGELPLPGAGRRALLLERESVAVDPDLVAVLERTGIETETAPGPGFGAMMEKPDVAKPPLEVFGTVERWLGARGTGEAPPPPDPRPAEAAGIRETPLVLEQPFGAAFGVLAEPLDGTAGVTVVFLNAGGIRRIGPNRMWTTTARRWAARGVPSLRLDLEGIGDADGDAGRYTDVGELYVPRFVTQVRAALDALAARGLPERFVLVGLCSGAYWGFQTALEDERVGAAILLNSRVLFWREGLDEARDARLVRRQLFRAASWRKVLRGDLPMPRERIAGVVRSLLRRPQLPADRVDAAFDRLRERDARLVLAFCAGEPLHEELRDSGHLDRLDAWPNVRLREIPGRDHTLRPLWMHPHVDAVLDEALADELARVAGATLA
jgi:pimeloyl-ACP methyl ester carboxylesterase